MRKNGKHLQSYGYDDFQEFLANFTMISKDPRLLYLSDAIFHLLLPREAGVEKRFKFGWFIWTLSILKKLIAVQLSTKAETPNTESSPQSPSYGFRFLDTPAHGGSLAPILDQVPLTSRLLYGREGEPLELMNSLSILGCRASLRALKGAVTTARRIHSIVTLVTNSTNKYIPADFTARMAEFVLTQQLVLTSLRKNLCPHQAIFLTFELNPESKAWVQWARDSGTRVIHVMHGQSLPIYQITMATDLVLFSKVDEQWFRERVDPSIKLWTIGHPRLESTLASVGLQETSTSPRRPRIAFFSQPIECDYSRELRMQDWKILSGLNAAAEVRFRLHPREDRETAIQDLKTLGLDFVEPSDAGLEEDLRWCDAIASSWSTVSMEAAVCGRGVFWTCSTPEKYEASQALRDYGIGTLVQQVGDWKNHLQDWKCGGWDAPVMVPESKLKKLGMIGDTQTPWAERLELTS
ncbi:hypothetical protein [Rubritalea profundi]|uniref:UDP-N-acetylglucosamine 2-epimerase domain-containing protein n=1 Tax=Rubritalea profundi TaxID=1658618 RepID=A0A2S7U0Q4_9BACT|nr:hypothetical protein [Rubritalea profundi]PQJ28087.1 hypothetical protein BSZ32_05925 [Rubritalea profundi]